MEKSQEREPYIMQQKQITKIQFIWIATVFIFHHEEVSSKKNLMT